MFGTQQFEDMASRPFFPLGKLLFWISLAAAQMAGVLVSWSFGGPAYLWMLLWHTLTAVLAFFILYRFLVLNLLAVLERRQGMKIEKPGVLRGLVYAVVIPLIMCGLGLVAVLYLSAASA